MPSISLLSTQSNCSSAKHQAFSSATRKMSSLLEVCTKNGPYLSALVFAAYFTTGCGGTPGHSMEDISGNGYSQTSNVSHSTAKTDSVASSFTVNPTDDFNGFNPERWNSQQSWTECNCGNNKSVEPRIMTWNPNA